MHIFDVAAKYPDKAAVIMSGSGDQLTYSQLMDRARRLANYFHEVGLRPGDRVAIMMENSLTYFEVLWAVMISRLYLTPVNSHLSVSEVSYIVNDCEAKVFVTSKAVADVAAQLLDKTSPSLVRLIVNGALDGYSSYEDAVASAPSELSFPPSGGALLFYSSGTTGRPKGIMRPLPKQGGDAGVRNMGDRFGLGPDAVYLSTQPLYHAAPLGFTLAILGAGASIVVMDKFDPKEALDALEKYKVTLSQWVPTMFSRMLKLPEEDRAGRTFPHHKMAIHGAAPCPVEVKRRMIEWWGPVIVEHYGGSEGIGMTMITSKEWLKRPGSVGRSQSNPIHICDENGVELKPGQPGTIFFEQPEQSFSYLKDDAKTRSAQHPVHPNWSTLGDIGQLDEEGFLFLVDRKSDMIISGGVNIYPAEVENVLLLHPDVADVAVFGVPHEDFGESVKAVVELVPGAKPDTAVAERLIEYCRDNMAHYKCPRSVDFIDELPRTALGKLQKRHLKEKYWADKASRLV